MQNKSKIVIIASSQAGTASSILKLLNYPVNGLSKEEKAQFIIYQPTPPQENSKNWEWSRYSYSDKNKTFSKYDTLSLNKQDDTLSLNKQDDTLSLNKLNAAYRRAAEKKEPTITSPGDCKALMNHPLHPKFAVQLTPGLPSQYQNVLKKQLKTLKEEKENRGTFKRFIHLLADIFIHAWGGRKKHETKNKLNGIALMQSLLKKDQSVEKINVHQLDALAQGKTYTALQQCGFWQDKAMQQTLSTNVKDMNEDEVNAFFNEVCCK